MPHHVVRRLVLHGGLPGGVHCRRGLPPARFAPDWIRKEQSGCVRDLHSCRWWIGFAIGQKMNLNFVPDGHLTRFPLGHCGRLESADSCLSYPFVTARRDKDADTCAQHPPAFYRSLDCIFVVYPQR